MRAILVAMSIGVATTSAHAAPLLWRGEVQVTTVVEATAGACRGGWFQGLYFTAIYQPGGLAGNGTTDSLSFFRESSAWQLTVTGGAKPSPLANLRYISRVGNFGSKDAVQLSGFVTSPTTIAPTTTGITLRLTVPDIFNNVGCRVSFYGLLQKSF